VQDWAAGLDLLMQLACLLESVKHGVHVICQLMEHYRHVKDSLNHWVWMLNQSAEDLALLVYSFWPRVFWMHDVHWTSGLMEYQQPDQHWANHVLQQPLMYFPELLAY